MDTGIVYQREDGTSLRLSVTGRLSLDRAATGTQPANQSPMTIGEALDWLESNVGGTDNPIDRQRISRQRAADMIKATAKDLRSPTAKVKPGGEGE